MDFHATARTLWQAWLDQEVSLATDQPQLPFFLMVDALLEARHLNATFDALFELSPPAADERELHRVMAIAQTWAEQTDAVGEDEDRSLRALLIGVPMGGPPASLNLDDGFWPLLESHLHAVLTPLSKRAWGEPLTLGLLPLATPVHPEACAQLTLDGLRQVTDELLEGEAGPRLTRLVHDHDHLLATLEPAGTAMAQRLALAVLVVDPEQFAAEVDVLALLSQEDPTAAAWTQQFSQATRWLFPPQDLVSAMTQALWYRLRMGVDQARLQRQLPLDDHEVSWAHVEENEAGQLAFTADANGTELDPVTVSGAWVALIGPDQVERMLGMWDDEIEGDDDEDTAAPILPRRLH